MNYNRGGQFLNQMGGGSVGGPSPWASGAPPYNPTQQWNGQSQQPSPWMSGHSQGYGNQGGGYGGGLGLGMNNYGPPMGGGYNTLPPQG